MLTTYLCSLIIKFLLLENQLRKVVKFSCEKHPVFQMNLAWKTVHNNSKKEGNII